MRDWVENQPDTQVLPVPPERAYEMWGTIRPGVIEVLRATGRDFEPEQVLEKIVSMECLLWVGFLSGYFGFAITRVDDLGNKKSLLIWMAHNARRDVDFIESGLPMIERYAREIGCDVVDCFVSPTETRSGKPMAERLGAFGFGQQHVAYRKVL